MIYIYFSNKDEILFALHEEGFHKLNKQFEAVMSEPNPYTRLEMFGKAYLKFGLKNPEYYELMFIQTAPLETLKKDEKKWENANDAFGYLSRTSAEILKKHPNNNTDPMTAALMFWSMVHGFVSLQLRDRVDWNTKNTQEFKAPYKAISWMVDILKK